MIHEVFHSITTGKILKGMKRVIKRVKKLFYGDVFVDLKPIFLSMRNYTSCSIQNTTSFTIWG